MSKNFRKDVKMAQITITECVSTLLWDLFLIFDQIGHVACERITDFVQNVAVVADYLVFIVIIYDMKANPRSFRQLISSDAVAVKIFVYC